MGVYLLIILGATTAITDAAAACSTWPTCQGQWIVPVGNVELTIAWGHRLAAALVGVLVTVTTVLAWLRGASRRVRAALLVPLALYPVQIGIGALAATRGTPTALSAVHLLVGMAIFTGLTLALAWTLEGETSDITPEDAGEPRTGQDSQETPVATQSSRSNGFDSEIAETAYAYFRLMKPRLMWLLCLVASAGMALAAGNQLQLGTVVTTLFGGVLAIGASGTFNHILERDIDEQMSRTSDRPLVSERISVRSALTFGTTLAVASLAVFATINVLTAVLGAIAILFYSVVYTLLLKPNTVQNTVLGGFAGSLPALIGWAAVTDGIGLPGILLAGVIFLWTPAHFYNLALAYKQDYEQGGFPMLSVVRGEVVTRKHILLYLGATLLGASVLSAVQALGWLYALTSVVFGSVFLWAVIRLHHEQSRGAALRSFHASNAYLGFLLLAIIVDTLTL